MAEKTNPSLAKTSIPLLTAQAHTRTNIIATANNGVSSIKIPIIKSHAYLVFATDIIIKK